MNLIVGYKDKNYRILTPTIFRRLVNYYLGTYDLRIESGDTYLVVGNNTIDSYLVDIVGYPKDGTTPVRLEVLD